MSKETFERLVQFAFTGDYTIPKAEVAEWVVKARERERQMRKEKKEKEKKEMEEKEMERKEMEKKEMEKKEISLGSSFDNISEPVCESKVRDSYDEDVMFSSIRSKKDKKKKKSAIRIVEEEHPATGVELGSEASYNSSFLVDREVYPRPPSPMLAADFNTLSYSLSAPRNNHLSACEPTETFSRGESYANIFLAHAALYSLSSFWLIDSLQALSLYKLHKTLCVFQLDEDHTNDVVELARYLYAEDARGIEEGNGGARGLVCQYMAQHAIELAASDGFMELLGEGGQFVKDFFKFELQRIH